MDPTEIESFEQLWRHHVAEHQDPRCRVFHYLGVVSGVMWTGMALATHRPMWLPVGLALAYGLAWIGHALFERNRPASFAFAPWDLVGHAWLLRAQLRMFGRASRSAGRRGRWWAGRAVSVMRSQTRG